jgi:transposase InsO family protein
MSERRERQDWTSAGRVSHGQSVHRGFNGRLRAEHLNAKLFFSVADAQVTLLEWQRDEVRPHSSLGQTSPREFVAAWQLTRPARGAILNLETI